MKVKELKKLLNKYDDEMEVLVDGPIEGVVGLSENNVEYIEYVESYYKDGIYKDENMHQSIEHLKILQSIFDYRKKDEIKDGYYIRKDFDDTKQFLIKVGLIIR